MELSRSMENLAQAASEMPPVEQPAANMEYPPSFGRREAVEGTEDMPPKIERRPSSEEVPLGRTREGPIRMIYRPEQPKDGRHMSAKELAAAALKESRDGRRHDVRKY